MTIIFMGELHYDYIHPVLISDDQDTYTITIELKENSFILGVPYVLQTRYEYF